MTFLNLSTVKIGLHVWQNIKRTPNLWVQRTQSLSKLCGATEYYIDRIFTLVSAFEYLHFSCIVLIEFEANCPWRTPLAWLVSISNRLFYLLSSCSEKQEPLHRNTHPNIPQLASIELCLRTSFKEKLGWARLKVNIHFIYFSKQGVSYLDSGSTGAMLSSACSQRNKTVLKLSV